MNVLALLKEVFLKFLFVFSKGVNEGFREYILDKIKKKNSFLKFIYTQKKVNNK